MNKGLLAVVCGFILLACGDGNVVVQIDPDVQFEEDSLKIEEYLTNNGFSEDLIGRTTNGTKYVILDSGSSDVIDESDFVKFNYTGKFLSDTIFTTTIQAEADSIRAALVADSVGLADKTAHELYLAVFAEDVEYEAELITYAASGWTLSGYIEGFREGIAEAFKHTKVGGTALILIPSASAYGTSGSGLLIEPNTVIIYTLKPVEVTKQP